MARIPTLISDPARHVMPDSGRPAMSTPDMFGAQVGEAEIRGGQQEMAAGMAMGAAITGLGVAAGNYFQADQKKKDDSATASGVANYDFTGDFIGLKKTGAKNGETFAQTVSNAYDAKVDKYIEGMPNDEVRNRVKQHLVSQKPRYVDAAEAFSNVAAVANDRLQADAGLMTQLNVTEADPTIDTYNDARQKGFDIIDTRPNVLPHEKASMRKKFSEDLALRRFRGLIRGANDDPAALGAIENELTAPGSPWKSILDESYTGLLDKVTSMKRTASSQESTAARAVLQTFADRNAKGEIIDPVELSIGQETIGKAKNSTILSQFAKIQAQQAIFRDHRVMPLDQQRDKIAEYRKTKGVGDLPAPIQAGISEGSALTGGQISVDYLAGKIGFEYGQHMASGDYGKGTGHKNADGTPSSDAMGVAQFISTTWLEVLRGRDGKPGHAAALGVDLNKSDAELLAMRADPVLSIKAAALHALDNKKILESSLNRPVNDGDLYFAHFLGAGGAVRFLQAATQSPNALATTSVDAKQVAANKPVFYDEQGRPRTNAQVRGFVTQGTLNNVSYVGFAKVQAAEMVLANTIKELKDDPITFAQKTGNFGDVGDVSSAEGIARRGVVVGQMAEFYKIPTSELKPLSKTEAEAFGNQARDGDTETTLGVMMQIQALKNPEAVRAANKQIGEKDSVFGRAAGLAFEQPDQFNVAADIIRGEKRMKLDKDVAAIFGTEQDVQAAFTKTVGKALAGTTHGTEIRKAAMAHYAERQFAKGDAKAGSVLNPALFEESIQAVLGGGGHPGGKAIENVNGVPTVLPNGLSGGEFNDALKRATPADYMTALSKWGTPPRYKDGAVIKPSEIASQGKFEAIGGGEYRIKMGDGSYALSAAYKDGSADFYIFRGDPAHLKQMAARTGVVTTLPSMAPGVTPATPRVIP